MNRYIYAQLHLDNSVNVFLTEVCQRNIITLQKREARIIILEIKSLAHIGGHLVDKTENTFVAAALFLIHQKSPELQSEIVILAFGNQNGMTAAAAPDKKLRADFRRIVHIVQYVCNFVTVYRYQNVPRPNVKTVHGRTLCHRFYFNNHMQTLSIEKSRRKASPPPAFRTQD